FTLLIEPGNAPVRTDDELAASPVEFEDGRRAPRLSRHAESPLLVSGRLVEGDDFARFVGRVDDHQIAKNADRRSRSLFVGPVADTVLPDFVTLEIEGIDSGGTEKDVDLLAVGGGRVRCVTVLRHLPDVVGLGRVAADVFRPHGVAGLAVDAYQVADE